MDIKKRKSTTEAGNGLRRKKYNLDRITGWTGNNGDGNIEYKPRSSRRPQRKEKDLMVTEIKEYIIRRCTQINADKKRKKDFGWQDWRFWFGSLKKLKLDILLISALLILLNWRF